MTLLFTAIFGIFSVIARLVPHLPNAAPVGAYAFFVGTSLRRRFGWFAPLLVMLVSDSIVGFYEWRVMAAVYASFIASYCLGRLVGRARRGTFGFLRTGGALVAGSLLFYLATNFAVWAFTPMYAKDFGGLLFAYGMGLPFLRATLMGDLIYAGFFFGVFSISRAFFMVIMRKRATGPPHRTAALDLPSF